MKKTGLLVVTILFGAVLWQGCETLKGAEHGAKKDVVNTGHNINRGVNAAFEADRKFQEKYW